MDKKIFLKIFYIITSAPIAVLSICLLFTNKQIRLGYYQAKRRLVTLPNSVKTGNLVTMLVCAEDHRFYSHLGFDPIAIIRAIYRVLRDGKLEGASTIEQQYVRTCTARYEISISRKVVEIAISFLLSITTSKNKIAHSYLAHAHYGHSIVGSEEAARILKKSCILKHYMCEPAAIVALLKYPMPKVITKSWSKKLEQRLSHINRKFKIRTFEPLAHQSTKYENADSFECSCSNGSWLPEYQYFQQSNYN